MERITLALSGMTCGHCVGTVRKALVGLDGVAVEHVGVNTVTIAVDPARTSLAVIEQTLDATGYPVASSKSVA